MGAAAAAAGGVAAGGVAGVDVSAGGVAAGWVASVWALETTAEQWQTYRQDWQARYRAEVGSHGS